MVNSVKPRNLCPELSFASVYRRIRTAALMRINIWIVLAALLALLAITRLSQYQHETQRICADDPSASVCGGELRATRAYAFAAAAHALRVYRRFNVAHARSANGRPDRVAPDLVAHPVPALQAACPE